MKTIEVTGKTVDEALKAGMEELGVEKMTDIEYEVLEEANPGFLGLLGGRPARIKMWLLAPEVKARRLLEEIMDRMGIRGETQISKVGEYYEIQVEGDDLGILIGRRGRTLDALQYLANLAANRGSSDRVRIIVDAASYRQRRAETLRNLAQRLCQRARRQRRKVVLEPMTPQERRIIHLTVQGEKGMTSYSQGEDPHRRVVIALEG